ncbi:LADA_0C04038g1_1 [Lachancea dasiensis]|uniref:LADA_0C04038g1_1 n=1 Tax=Lachancea dasiensis TaxID=1072105 RepID=A0A1G4IYF3_9SACH|nr:LADA_0C04038g1_1 [Lachancea dasiensis]
MPFKLSTNSYKEQDLPEDPQELLSAGKQLMDEVCTSWKKGKCYHHTLSSNPTLDSSKVAVQTYYTNRDKDYWLSRVSEHSLDLSTYERLVKVLTGSVKENSQWTLRDRTARSRLEKEYIEVLSAVEVLKVTDSGWVGVNLEYELGKPLTTREFNEWIYIIPPFQEAEGEVCMVISVVADAPLRDPEAHTRGVYTSIEMLEYNHKSQQLKWKMATTSDAGGNVPKWVQNSMIAKTVSKDVSYMFEWLGQGKDRANI